MTHLKAILIALVVTVTACGGAEADPTTTSSALDSVQPTASTEVTTTTTTTTEAATAPSSGVGQLVIASIDFDAGTYAIRNDGDGPLDITGYFACNRPNYVELPSQILQPGETVEVSTGGLSLQPGDGELGVYTSQSFSSASAIVGYVQWGSDGHGRTDTAVSGGVWTSGQFVDNGGGTITSSGSAPTSAADWTSG